MKYVYKDGNSQYAAKTLWEAICKPYERGSQSPPQIDKWIECQADAYMEKDWDDEWNDVSKPCSECGHKSFKGDRYQWAYERASDDFDDFIGDINKGDDKQVAEFFNISDEIESYELDNGDTIEAKDVIGTCNNCNNVFAKKDLFNYSDTLKKEECDSPDDDAIGICSNCGEQLFSYEVTDKDVSMVVSL